MTAAEALRLGREHGIRVRVAGADLILDADRAPAQRVLETIRRYKPEIVALLATEHDEPEGGRLRARAEAVALESRIVEWLNRHPCRSDPGRCAWCEKHDRDGRAVVPFGIETRGHIWLHPECWSDWHGDRRAQAQRALAKEGLHPPETWNGAAESPKDFGKNGDE
jgi:hypothetical protein